MHSVFANTTALAQGALSVVGINSGHLLSLFVVQGEGLLFPVFGVGVFDGADRGDFDVPTVLHINRFDDRPGVTNIKQSHGFYVIR